jgi:arylsulfatase A-like enzyme
MFLLAVLKLIRYCNIVIISIKYIFFHCSVEIVSVILEKIIAILCYMLQPTFRLYRLFFMGLILSNNLLAQKNAKPNIILIYADDLGYGDLSCYGATAIQTPNIDKLADKGLRFTNAHSAASTCTPSRYAMIMGEYAWRKKGTGILPGNASMIIPVGKINLPTVFKNAGYKTAIVGKWHLGLGNEGGPDWNNEIKPGPNEVGFDYAFFFPATADRVPTVFIENKKVVGWDANDSIKVSYTEKIGAEPTGKENPELLKMNALKNQGHEETIVNGIGRIGYMTGGKKARWNDEELAYTFTDKAKSFISNNTKNSFFLFFSLNDIHAPRMPSTTFRGSSALGARGEMINQLDWTVGEIVKELQRLNMEKNTMIIFTSDNGPALLDGYEDNAEILAVQANHKPTGPMRGGKYSVLEAGTRVPMIVSWPKKIKSGVSNTLMSQLDFIKSFASYFKQPLSDAEAIDSENNIKSLLGKSAAGRTILIEQGQGSIAILWNDWKYIIPSKGAAVFQPMNIESGNSIQPQLYNLKDDIGEKNNLAEKHPDMVKKLAAMLNEIKAKK